MSKQQTSDNKKIRLDKWLWAARFYKTRAIAKAAVEGGKVHYEGQRCKVSKTVDLNAKLTIRQGVDEKITFTLFPRRKRAKDVFRRESFFQKFLN